MLTMYQSAEKGSRPVSCMSSPLWSRLLMGQELERLRWGSCHRLQLLQDLGIWGALGERAHVRWIALDVHARPRPDMPRCRVKGIEQDPTTCVRGRAERGQGGVPGQTT